ncbi:hypothetical protein M405DRAFT_48968 [Rhizopogon salebrosus TDB-379]|nr:hypothetical protein M405DRAFT_48968 [Rhizopogon salebrosus TDB-379]
MDGIHRSHHLFTHLKHRGIVPLIDEVVLPGPDVPSNPENVQGDILHLFPKVAEDFIFFRISDVIEFRKRLASFEPTHGKQVYNHLLAIHEAKAKNAGWVTIVQKQIAFSRPELNLLGLTEKTGDGRFDVYCMRDNKRFLGDGMPWDRAFDKPNTDADNGTANVDDGAIHGIISIAGSDR